MSVQVATPPARADRMALGLPAGSPGRRILAHAIDLVLVAAVVTAVYLPTGSVLLGAVVLAEAALGLAVWEARSGRTVGKSVLGVRAAQAGTDYAPGLGKGVVRSLLLGASHALALVGQFLLIATSALDRTGGGQAWHDRAAGTRVVDVRPDARAKTPAPRYAPAAAPGGLAPDGAGTGVPAGVPVPPHQPMPGAPGPVSTAPAYGQIPATPSDRQFPAPQGQPTPAHTWYRPAPGPAAAGEFRSNHLPRGSGPGAATGAYTRPPAPLAPEAPQAETPGAPGRSTSSSATDLPAHTFDPARAGAADPRTLDPSELPDMDEIGDAGAGQAVFVLTASDGTSVTVTGTGLIGRRPQPRPDEHVAHTMAVDDPGRSLSRTHAAFGVDGEDFWVEDRGSANGTVVVTAEGSRTRALPGKRVPVPSGARIEAGERIFTVHRLPN